MSYRDAVLKYVKENFGLEECSEDKVPPIRWKENIKKVKDPSSGTIYFLKIRKKDDKTCNIDYESIKTNVDKCNSKLKENEISNIELVPILHNGKIQHGGQTYIYCVTKDIGQEGYVELASLTRNKDELRRLNPHIILAFETIFSEGFIHGDGNVGNIFVKVNERNEVVYDDKGKPFIKIIDHDNFRAIDNNCAISDKSKERIETVLQLKNLKEKRKQLSHLVLMLNKMKIKINQTKKLETEQKELIPLKNRLEESCKELIHKNTQAEHKDDIPSHY